MQTTGIWMRGLGLILLILPMGINAVSLDDYLWRNRLLILVAPEGSDPAVEQVLETSRRHLDEFNDRHLLVIQLFEYGQSLVNGRPVSAGQAKRLRDRLDVNTGDRLLLLVGKDGGVKRRAALLTDLHEIFRQIDAMPMRREEIRAGRAADGS